MHVKPELITFDIFGTVLDWQTGLSAACAAVGRPLLPGEFDRIIDLQGALEQGSFLSYTEITARSLEQILGLEEKLAREIGARAGEWPLFADSSEGLRALMKVSPCAAMSNSDRAHGEEIQRRMGMRLSDWICAEETRVYKPNPEFWHQVARRKGIQPGKHWWHVSAYADYDLAVCDQLGLTTVFVSRPHSRPGAAAHVVSGLDELAKVIRL